MKDMEKPDLSTMTGCCRFCGQSCIVDMDPGLSGPERQPYADEKATRFCNCRTGEAYREEAFVAEEAEKLINEMLMDEYPEIARMCVEAIPFIWHGKIKRMVCTTDHKGNVLIFRDKNSIKIKTQRKLETEAVAAY